MDSGLLILSTKDKSYISLYNTELTEDKATLKFSDLQDKWTYPGKVSCELIDTGNGYRFISYSVDGDVNSDILLDYSQAVELRALLKLLDKDGSTFEHIKRNKR